MAKKAKTPPPPRRVQAPKPRSAQPANERRTRMILYGTAAAGVIALIAVVAVLATGGSSGSSGVASAMQAAGCTFKTVDAFVPKGQSTHVPSLTKKIDWNTFPPSNGQHYPLWAVWDFYTQPINPRRVVHNEEHGGVILWWGPQTPAATVDKLRSLYNESPEGMLGTPIAGLGDKVAITAWTGDPSRYQQNGYYGQGHIATCPAFSAKTEDAFKQFRDAFRGKGPEGIPMSQNQPGMGPG
jgi:hypothetical protein